MQSSEKTKDSTNAKNNVKGGTLMAVGGIVLLLIGVILSLQNPLWLILAAVGLLAAAWGFMKYHNGQGKGRASV